MEQQLDNRDLPAGWSRTTSRSRPGTVCYEHVNGRRLFRIPTAADDTFPKTGRKHGSTPQGVPSEQGKENPQDVGSVASISRSSQVTLDSRVSGAAGGVRTPTRPSAETSKSTPPSSSRGGSRVAVIPQKPSESRTAVARSLVQDDDEFDFPGTGRKSEVEGAKGSKQDSSRNSTNLNRADIEIARPPPSTIGNNRQTNSDGNDAKKDEQPRSLSRESSRAFREKQDLPARSERGSDRNYNDGAGRKNDRRSPPRRPTRSRSPAKHTRRRLPLTVRSRSTDRPYERPPSRSSLDGDRNRDRFGLGDKRRDTLSSTTAPSSAARGPAETRVVTGNYISGMSRSAVPKQDAQTRKFDDDPLKNQKNSSTGTQLAGIEAGVQTGLPSVSDQSSSVSPSSSSNAALVVVGSDTKAQNVNSVNSSRAELSSISTKEKSGSLASTATTGPPTELAGKGNEVTEKRQMTSEIAMQKPSSTTDLGLSNSRRDDGAAEVKPLQSVARISSPETFESNVASKEDSKIEKKREMERKEESAEVRGDKSSEKSMEDSKQLSTGGTKSSLESGLDRDVVLDVAKPSVVLAGLGKGEIAKNGGSDAPGALKVLEKDEKSAKMSQSVEGSKAIEQQSALPAEGIPEKVGSARAQSSSMYSDPTTTTAATAERKSELSLYSSQTPLQSLPDTSTATRFRENEVDSAKVNHVLSVEKKEDVLVPISNSSILSGAQPPKAPPGFGSSEGVHRTVEKPRAAEQSSSGKSSLLANESSESNALDALKEKAKDETDVAKMEKTTFATIADKPKLDENVSAMIPMVKDKDVVEIEKIATVTSRVIAVKTSVDSTSSAMATDNEQKPSVIHPVVESRSNLSDAKSVKSQTVEGSSIPSVVGQVPKVISSVNSTNSGDRDLANSSKNKVSIPESAPSLIKSDSVPCANTSSAVVPNGTSNSARVPATSEASSKTAPYDSSSAAKEATDSSSSSVAVMHSKGAVSMAPRSGAVQSLSSEGRSAHESRASVEDKNSVLVPKRAGPATVAAGSASDKPSLKTSISDQPKVTTTPGPVPTNSKPPLMTSLSKKAPPPPTHKPPLVTSASTNTSQGSKISSAPDPTKDKKLPLVTSLSAKAGSSVNRSLSSNEKLVSSSNTGRPLSTTNSTMQSHHAPRHNEQDRAASSESRSSAVQEQQDRKRARMADTHSQGSGSSSERSFDTHTSQPQGQKRHPSPPKTSSIPPRLVVESKGAQHSTSLKTTVAETSDKSSLQKIPANYSTDQEMPKSTAIDGAQVQEENAKEAPVEADLSSIREWMERNLFTSTASRRAVSDNSEELRRLGTVLVSSLAKNISTVCVENALVFDVTESLSENYSVDLSPCFVPGFPSCAAQFFKRFGALYPAESTGWYVAKTHAYYRTLVPEEPKKSDESKTEQRPIIMAVRISGLPEEHKLLNGLYARPTIPNQPGDSIKKETFIFKKGEVDDAIVKALLGRFALIHFVGRQWTLQRIDRANQLACLATGDDAAANWVYATGMGEGALAWRRTSSIKLELLNNGE